MYSFFDIKVKLLFQNYKNNELTIEMKFIRFFYFFHQNMSKLNNL